MCNIYNAHPYFPDIFAKRKSFTKTKFQAYSIQVNKAWPSGSGQWGCIPEVPGSRPPPYH